MDTQKPWQKAGLTDDEWLAHVLREAASQRNLARFHAEVENVQFAQRLMNSAIARELYVAGQRGEVTRAETQVLAVLLRRWTGSSTEEVLATARDILAGRQVDA